VQLQDEFSAKPVPVALGKPVQLCLPTLKFVGGTIYQVLNPITHPLCFAVSPTPRINPVYDENQFG